MNITGLHHVAIRAKGEEQMKKAADFYVNELGMSFIGSWGEGEAAGCMVGTGGLVIEMFADAGRDKETGPIDHIALAVDDVDGYIDIARRRGLKITMEPQDIVIGMEPALYARVGFCMGEAGELIEFFDEKKA